MAILLGVLYSRLAAASIPIVGVADNGDGSYRVDFAAEATMPQQSDAAVIVAAFDPVAEQGILDAQAIQVQLGIDFNLPDWSTWTALEAEAAVRAAIFAGNSLVTAQSQIDTLPATIAGMKTGLKSAANEIITIRNILEKMAKAIV